METSLFTARSMKFWIKIYVWYQVNPPSHFNESLKIFMDLVLVKWHCAETAQYWRVQKKIFYKAIKQNSNVFQESLFPRTVTDTDGELLVLLF